MPKDENYWQKRLDKIFSDNYSKKEIKKIYAKAYKDIESDIMRLYEELKEKGEITATQLYRYGRFQGLLREIENISADIKSTLAAAVSGALTNAYKETFGAAGNMAGQPSEWTMINETAVKTAVSKQWAGSNYSRRIWENTDKLARRIKADVIDCIVRGTNKDTYVKAIKKEFSAETYKADRLMRTELAHTMNTAAIERYKSTGIKKVRWSTAFDARTCGPCGNMNGKTFNIEDMGVKINVIQHPNCRCAQVPVIDGANDTVSGERTARDPKTGHNYRIPADMSWEQWEQLVDDKYGAGTTRVAKKKAVRKSYDKKQYEQYMSVLGKKNIPKTFDKWQDLKYNNNEAWEFVKLDYRRQKILINNPALALPNAAEATADNRKFTEYLFNSDNADGWAKGRAFTSRLGYDIDNYKDLKNEILKQAGRYPSTYKDTDEFGSRYEQKIILYGNKNMPANVVVGWKEKDGKTWLTSAYIKEVE